MSTKTTKTPAAKTTRKPKAPKATQPRPDALDLAAQTAAASVIPSSGAGVVPPVATPADITRINIAAGEVAMATVMPGLVAKYGPANPEPVEGKKFVVDPACAREYTAAKAQLVRDMVSREGFAITRAPMVHITTHEEQAMSKTEEQTTTTQQKAEKASKAKHEVVTTPHGEFRKGSVLHAIYRSFELKAGATKDEILDRLVKEFPDRTRDEMSSTVNTQINRMPKERGFKLGRDDKGRYGLHIEGWSKARILSPEAAAKAEAKAAEAAAKKQAKEAEKAAAAEAKAKAKADAVAANAKAKGITVNLPNAQVVGQAVSAAKAAKAKK